MASPPSTPRTHGRGTRVLVAASATIALVIGAGSAYGFATYQQAKGEGTIKCTDGQSMPVSIKSTGGGLTFGTQEILNGVGDFSDVNSLDELLGSYAAGEASAGAGKAATAQVVTKGEVSLALSGTGEGVNLGISFGKFTIKKR